MLKGSKSSEESKYKNRIAHLGKKASYETRLKMSLVRKGRKFSVEHRKSLSENNGNKGPKGHWWKGGLTAINSKLKNSLEYKLWREQVFKRDLYICQFCGDSNFVGRGQTVILEADHIKPWSKYPELRFDVTNGRTLCRPCHKKTDTYGRKCNSTIGVSK